MGLGVEDMFLTGYYLLPVHICGINGLSLRVFVVIYSKYGLSLGLIPVELFILTVFAYFSLLYLDYKNSLDLKCMFKK